MLCHEIGTSGNWFIALELNISPYALNYFVYTIAIIFSKSSGSNIMRGIRPHHMCYISIFNQ